MRRCLATTVLVLAAVTASAVLAAPAPAPAPAQAAAAAVNVNTASVDELATVRGIGPALAERIVEHRKQHGPFKTAEDLLAVKGIGPKLLAKIRDRLAFGAAPGTR
jgi:competence protein ComEA